MVEYMMLSASSAKQLLLKWTAHLSLETALVAAGGLLLVWLVWRAFVVRR
jgi:hypothetical protein